MFVYRGMKERRFMLAVLKLVFCVQMMLFSLGVNWMVNISSVYLKNRLSSLWNELMQRCPHVYLHFVLAF